MSKKLFLVFQLNKERFAIESQYVTEVLPMVNISHIPKTRDYVAGMINYRGAMTPVIDLCRLLTKHYCEQKVCSRIIIINNKYHNEFSHTGIVAEQVNNTARLDSEQFVQHTLIKNGTDYLGYIAQDGDHEIQIIELDRLLPEEVNHVSLNRIAR